MDSLKGLPLVGLGGDPVFLQLVSKQCDSYGNQPGSLLNEYPFTYSLASYLWDISAELKHLIGAFQAAGAPHGVLRAIHFRLECCCHLAVNRLSIIQASVDHGMSIA